MLTQERLKELLFYDPLTGVFTWLMPGTGRRKSRVAGSKRKDGYINMVIDGNNYLAQRIAFFYITGRWPTPQVDHKDLDRSNNTWANLREATVSQNHANKVVQRRNVSGYKGAYWYAPTGKWVASITRHGKTKNLGYFDNPQEAHLAYCGEALKHYGNFARF